MLLAAVGVHKVRLSHQQQAPYGLQRPYHGPGNDGRNFMSNLASSSVKFRCQYMYPNVTSSFNVQSSLFFSTSAKQNQQLKNSKKATSFFTSTRLRYIARGILYIRIPALILSVYSIGYTNGITDYIRNPRKWQESMAASILTSVGCDLDHLEDQVQVAVQGEWMHDKEMKKLYKIAMAEKNRKRISSSSLLGTTQYDNNAKDKELTDPKDDAKEVGYGILTTRKTNDEKTNDKTLEKKTTIDQETKRNRLIQLVNVAYVSEKILQSAKQLVSEQLEKAYQKDSNTGELTPIMDEAEIDKWTTAYDSLETDGFTKWKFVLIDVPMVNAFVSETTPYTIYITTALLEHVVSNDDELALVLGHELSHLLMAHNSKAMVLERNLKTIEVLLLAMDPTQGALSLFFMACITYLRKITSASNSRQNENEADELGIKLAAMSCFDTHRAPKVFAKMYEHHIQLEEQLYGTTVLNKDQQEHGHNQTQKEAQVAEIDKPSPTPSPSSLPSPTIKRDDRGYTLSSYLDSHPPSLLRYENLLEMSKEENPSKYQSQCSNTRSYFFQSLKVFQ